MAARSPRDLIDYVYEDSENEDGSLFLPVPSDSGTDEWSAFWGGLLIGLAGAGLVTLAPWLGGLLVFVGYGMTALSLRGSRSGFGQALRFGYGLLAFVGAAMLLGVIVFPNATASLIAAAAERHLIFISLATLAWPVALLKLVLGRVLRRDRLRRRLARGVRKARGPG